MTKTIISWGTALLMLCSGLLTSCNNDEGGGELPVPSVTIAAGNASSTTLQFTLTLRDADKCTYLCTPKADPAPTADQILSGGTTITASGTVTIDQLTPNTTYILSAVAAKGKAYSKLETLQNTTSAPDVHPAVVLTAGTVTPTTLTFSAALSNSETAAYVCLEKTATLNIPKAEAIIADGRPIAESGEFKVEQLTEGTTYIIAAAVVHSGIYSEVTTIEMTTSIPAPIVTVMTGSSAETTLTFSVALSGFDKAAFLCIKKEEGTPVPTAEKILAEGSPITKSDLFTVEGLEAGTLYMIAVAAQYKTVYSEVKTIEMTTQAAAGGPLTFNRQVAGGYYGVPEGGRYGEYLVVVADGETVENEGVYTTTGAGHAMSIDFYQFAPTTTASITLPDRNYNFSTTKGMTTFHPDKTYCMVNDGKGTITKVTFTSGTIKVSKIGSTYTFAIALTTTDGEEFNATYTGPAVIENKTESGIAKLPELEKDVKDMNFIRALAKYYHPNEGYDQCVVNLYDVEPTVNQGSDYLSTAGHMLSLDLTTAVSEKMQLQEGIYKVSATEKPGTFTAGEQVEFMDTMLAIGTYCEERNDKFESVYGFVNSGTVKITRSGDNYRFEIDFTTSKYYYITGTYEGKVEMTDKRN